MVKKTNVKISKNNWERLQEIEGGTIDKKLNVLMDIVEPHMPFVDYSTEFKSIKAYSDTLDRLDGFHITGSESRDNILTRIFIMLDELNNTSTVEWIPFKITNRYNNLLVIDGQLEYSTKEYSFNYRGNVFRGKLPPTYVVQGKDLTKELYIWYDNLDWATITNMILTNYEEGVEYETDNYNLIVNPI